jgi:hypothetical protein
MKFERIVPDHPVGHVEPMGTVECQFTEEEAKAIVEYMNNRAGSMLMTVKEYTVTLASERGGIALQIQGEGYAR